MTSATDTPAMEATMRTSGASALLATSTSENFENRLLSAAGSSLFCVNNNGSRMAAIEND